MQGRIRTARPWGLVHRQPPVTKPEAADSEAPVESRRLARGLRAGSAGAAAAHVTAGLATVDTGWREGCSEGAAVAYGAMPPQGAKATLHPA